MKVAALAKRTSPKLASENWDLSGKYFATMHGTLIGQEIAFHHPRI